MMRREKLHEQLNRAVAENLVTVVHGLPRAGRSNLIRSWIQRRPGAKLMPDVNEPAGDASVLVFDHFSSADIKALVERFRAGEAMGSEAKFIVIPTDFVTTRLILNSLIGSAAPFEVTPLQLSEVTADHLMRGKASGPVIGGPQLAQPTSGAPIEADRLWLRGGLPESLSKANDSESLLWRQKLIEGLMKVDYTSFGLQSFTRMEDILRWVANQNGGELDDTKCSAAPKAQEARSALFVLKELNLTRHLRSYPLDSPSSIEGKPKVYIRDSGILHAMLGIEDLQQLRAHSAIGSSWESYAIEALTQAAGALAKPQFFRAKGLDGKDNEIDLILDFQPYRQRVVAIEFKVGPNQTVKPGFFAGCAIVKPTDQFIVHAGVNASRGGSVEKLDLNSALQRISSILAD